MLFSVRITILRYVTFSLLLHLLRSRKEKVHHFHGSDSDSDSQEEMDNNEGILSDFDSSDSSVDFMFRENAEAQKSVMNALDVHSDEEFDDGQMQQTKAMLDARGKSTDKYVLY